MCMQRPMAQPAIVMEVEILAVDHECPISDEPFMLKTIAKL